MVRTEWEKEMLDKLLSNLKEGIDPSQEIWKAWRINQEKRAWKNLQTIAMQLPADSLPDWLTYFHRILPSLADADMALNNLDRWFQQIESKKYWAGLLEEQGRGLEILLQLFSTSQFLADVLISYPGDILRVRNPQSVSLVREDLVEQLGQQLKAVKDGNEQLNCLREFRQRYQLIIGAKDIIWERSIEEITRELSWLAEALVEVALRLAETASQQKYGMPFGPDGEPATRCLLAFGKLGGEELNYSSDIDLMFIYDPIGKTRGGKMVLSNDEYYSRLVTEMIRILSTHTERGQVYRVDFRLRPEGERGPLVRSLDSTIAYYDTMGRTWERQALIKVRPIAGNLELGQEFLRLVEPFVYRRYLSFAEINEIKAMKRRIEQISVKRGDSNREVKTGHGGIRDIEFTIQFLQLLNGGDEEMQRIRCRNTLAAMSALEMVGCLTDPEYRTLDDGYRFLRKAEHRLQLMFDLQTHRLPETASDLQKLAIRMGYANPVLNRTPVLKVASSSVPADSEIVSLRERGIDSDFNSDENLETLDVAEGRGNNLVADKAQDKKITGAPQRVSPIDELVSVPDLDTKKLLIEPLEVFLHDYLEKTERDRTILDHLLHQTFPNSDGQAEPETDLILSGESDEQIIQTVLGRYPFQDVMGAYRHLLQLGQEAGPFLSTRRCRHFLASIAPQLLRAVAETVDPDRVLLNLERVTASLGAKAVLWELFSFNPPSLKLYVDLCAQSSFLSEILMNNPGMIDDLLDSLILNRPRAAQELQLELKELLRGVDKEEIIEQILHSFQDKELLRIGVRDLLNKDTIQETTSALSDLAETILLEVVQRQENQLQRRSGIPILSGGDRQDQIARYTLLAMGKLGGREMNYQSDLDLVLLYEGEGKTVPLSQFQLGKPYDHLANQLSIPEPQFTNLASEFNGEYSGLSHLSYFTELAQRVIRVLGQIGPLGKLYAVDMRLRPMGKSGSLVVSLPEYENYLCGGSVMLWERQSLTRARCLGGDPIWAAQVMNRLSQKIFLPIWSADQTREIRHMRYRLDASASQRSLKRAIGAAMDIEFIVQLLQLKYGHRFPSICQTNIWHALRELGHQQLLSLEELALLQESYSFQRLAEAKLRIATNRAINEYPEDRVELEKLARRMSPHLQGETSGTAFRQYLAKLQQQTRTLFEAILQREESDLS